MPNHVHLILVPNDEDGLRRALSVVHRRYAGHVHARLKRTGHFWQGRFGCVAMDESHLGAALRYVALNPVRAGLAERATDWPWSSIHAHLGQIDDGITNRDPVLSRYPDFAALLAAGGRRGIIWAAAQGRTDRPADRRYRLPRSPRARQRPRAQAGQARTEGR